nr:MAG TPA: SCIMP protein [Microviridae sp.]
MEVGATDCCFCSHCTCYRFRCFLNFRFMSYWKLFWLIVGVIAATYLIPLLIGCIFMLILHLCGVH